jgi:hypothetical protein
MIKRTLLAASALALTLVGAPALTGANAQAASADITNGAYTDPTPYVRQSLTQEHMYLGHSNAVRSPGQAAFASEPRAYSAPVWSTLAVVGKDLSIGSQR